MYRGEIERSAAYETTRGVPHRSKNTASAGLHGRAPIAWLGAVAFALFAVCLRSDAATASAELPNAVARDTPPSRASRASEKTLAKPSTSAASGAARSTTNAARLEAQRKAAAKVAALPITGTTSAASSTRPYSPAYAPLPANANASKRASSDIRLTGRGTRESDKPSLRDRSSLGPQTSLVVIAPTSIDANVMQNLREPFAQVPVEMGDRPGRGTSLCSEGKVRRFGDLDSRTLASNLPDFNVVRPRSICVRKRSLIADYAFR
jgi:hypothetical protein